MTPGCEINPITLRPVEEERAAAARSENQKSAAALEDQAGFLPVAASEAAATLAAMIEAVLISRVEIVLAQDPEAVAMLKILRAFTSERDHARRAVKALMKTIKSP